MAGMSLLQRQHHAGTGTSRPAPCTRPLSLTRPPASTPASPQLDLLRSRAWSQSSSPRSVCAWSSSAAISPGQGDAGEPSTSQAAPEHQNGNGASGHGTGRAGGQASNSEPAPASTATDSPPVEQPKSKGGNFSNRVLYGSILGFGGAAVVLYGQWAFLSLIVFVAYQAAREYFTFITSKGISKGMTPPPPMVTNLTTVLCVSIAVSSGFLKGRSGMVLAVSAFVLLVLNVLTVRKPRFAQLASTVFGIFYCGWLPSFWVKLRNISTHLPDVPLMAPLQGYITWNVGLLATLTAVACVIAADTGAYFVGKNLGRTKLTDISPKKTVEGALGGLASSVAVAVLSYYATQWPTTILTAAGFGVIVFFASLFGDLIESIMKREAEMKDSGDLIPGHGGLLDRFDSYMFTGAVVYAYVLYVLGAV